MVNNFTETAYSLEIQLVDDYAVVVDRVVINNRFNEVGCDILVAKYLRTGDSINLSSGDCGGKTVKIDIFSNRGNYKYNLY